LDASGLGLAGVEAGAHVAPQRFAGTMESASRVGAERGRRNSQRVVHGPALRRHHAIHNLRSTTKSNGAGGESPAPHDHEGLWFYRYPAFSVPHVERCAATGDSHWKQTTSE